MLKQDEGEKQETWLGQNSTPAGGVLPEYRVIQKGAGKIQCHTERGWHIQESLGKGSLYIKTAHMPAWYVHQEMDW